MSCSTLTATLSSVQRQEREENFQPRVVGRHGQASPREASMAGNAASYREYRRSADSRLNNY